jgi:putative peptide zinc metalloprotease protein
MANERPTFSPLWHRVRALKPRLRPHVQITRQHYRGRRWHIAHDPASNQFYRLSPVGYEFVGLLDGKRTVEEVWDVSLGNHGDAAPTQQEVIELLGQMYSSNLLAIDAAPETEQLLSRGRERTKRRIAQQAIGLMYFRLRLFNPDRYLSFLEPMLRPLINKWGFLLWAAWLVYCIVSIIPHWEAVQAMFRDATAPTNLAWLTVIFIAIKFIHETGHGVICKRFGGQVPEFGVMLLVLLPSPYVDASSAWSFPSKWQRMAVGAGGMIFELAIAGAAVHLFIHAPDAQIKQLAFNAMLTASISTVFFNANPLMRFDGYYILSDLLEVPNLMQRSNRMLMHLAQKFIYRVENLRAPTSDPTERVILVVFGILAVAYRIFLFFTITLYVLGQFFAVGLVLAVWSAAAWFLIPIGKFVHWLASSPQLAEFRARAIATSLGLLGAAWVCLGMIRAPDHRRASGVVESVQRSGVFFGANSEVVEVHKRLGDRVNKGDVIARCEAPTLESGLALARAQLAEAEAKEREYTASDPGAAQVARKMIEMHEVTVAKMLELISELEVRSPQDGVLVAGVGGGDPGDYAGAFVRRGQMLCEVVDAENIRIAATVDTARARPLMELPVDQVSVEFRSVARPYEVVRGGGVRVIPAGTKKAPHAALTFQGGGTLENDPQDQQGLATKTSEFTVYVDPQAKGQEWRGVPGERVTVRFTLPSKPLLAQWWHRFEKLLQGRADI